MPEKKSTSINLVKGKEKDFFDKFINWALTIGRLVVILTETIALSAFLYRFSLDRQLIDLRDQIKQKEAIVKLLKNNEDKFRNLQDRLVLASKTEDTSSKTVAILKETINLAPKGFVFNTLNVSKDSIKINANAQSVTALTNFIKSLRDNPNITSVSLDKIENKTASALIVVGITATIKQ